MLNPLVLREPPPMLPHIAKLVSKSRPFQLPGKLLVTELCFEVPLDYANPHGKAIKLFGRTTTRYERPIVDPALDDAKSAQKPYLVFLQGGPGFGNPAPDSSPLTRHMLDRGYELLLLDYRGVGHSCPVTPESLSLVGSPREQADYLKLFRADNIVRDLEAVRKCLTRDYPREKQKWSTWGQSFGGMTSMTYLSFHPEGLRECFITGGLGALDQNPDQVYSQTYNKVMERNMAYYNKYPDDVATVKAVAQKIHETAGGVPLPAGGTLTVPMLMTLGLSFGGHGGLDHVHNLVLKMKGDLDQFGLFTRPTLNALEQDLGFDTAPIYSMLHEPCWIYGPGIAANWAAERVGQTLPAYQWLRTDWAGPHEMKDDEPLYFSGEMVYPFFFDTYGGLKPLKQTAQILAEYDQWPPLYDTEQLKKNEVPVYAACYEDMYVDSGTARITASKIKGIKVFETNVLYHSALRHRADDVFQELLRLRDDTID